MSTFTALIGLIGRRRMWSWWTARLTFEIATESHTLRLHRYWVFRLWKFHGVCVYVRSNKSKSKEVDCIKGVIDPMQSLSQNVNRGGSYVPLRSLHHAKDVYDSSQVCSRALQTVLSCPLSPSSSSSLLVPPSSPLSSLSLLQASLFQLETNVIHERAGHTGELATVPSPHQPPNLTKA